jgi:hypothetical protein
MRHYLQFLLDKNFIPWTDGKIETLKYYLSFDYKVIAKIQTDDESWFIVYLTIADKTSYIVSSDTIRPIDDYTLFKLSEMRYIPQLHYTINILNL